MSDFNLNIFTPNGVLVKGLKSSSLTVPTTNGEINVLPGHTHMVSVLETGVMTAKTSNGNKHYSITSGLIKILGQEINILSTTSEHIDDIDIERAQASLAKANSRLLSSTEVLTDVDRIKFQRKVQRARTRIKLANLK